MKNEEIKGLEDEIMRIELMVINRTSKVQFEKYLIKNQGEKISALEKRMIKIEMKNKGETK